MRPLGKVLRWANSAGGASIDSLPPREAPLRTTAETGFASPARLRGLQALDERQSLFELRELTLVRFECGGMDTPAKPAHSDWMLEVEHFVIEQVLDRVARTRGPIEYAAHDDSVMGGIVMAQRAPSQVLTPGELRPAQKTAEEPEVECFEDFLEVVEAAFRAGEAFGASGVANQFRLPRDGGAGREPLEAQVLSSIDRLAVKLGQQDVGNRA